MSALNIKTTATAATLGLCFLCGCATVPSTSRIIPVPGTGDVYPFGLASIRSPEGAGWVQLRTEADGIVHQVFLRKGDTASHQYIAHAAEVQTASDVDDEEEIKAQVVDRLMADYSGGQSDPFVSQEYIPGERYGVAGYDLRAEQQDTDAPQRGEAAFLRKRMFGHVVEHPDRPGHYVFVAYVERGLPGELDADAEAKAEAYLDGLQLDRDPR